MSKYKRRTNMRRSYMRTYSADYVGGANMKTPNAQVLAEYNARAAGQGCTEIDRLSPKVLQHLKKNGSYHVVNIVSGRYTTIDLFFDCEHSIFFMKENKLLKTLQRSLYYSTRSSAMRAWSEGRIVWLEEFPGV